MGEEDLNLRRAQQDAARETAQQLGATFINRSIQEEVIPSSVDLMERPDCLDDVIALASTICSLGLDHSWKFWSNHPDGRVLPSRFLLEVERNERKDQSLLPGYLSYLAALANDEASANAVHAILSRTTETSADA